MKEKISVCLIVKNESRWIEACLRSIIDWVDEIILVDTGSTDNTVELARNMGVQIFYYSWEDDFAKARNYSLSKATGDWILVLDADEVIAVSDRDLIFDCIRNPRAEMYSLVQTTYSEESATLGWIPNHLNDPEAEGYPGYLESRLVRLFKNSGEIYFDGCVHEHAKHKNPKIFAQNCSVRIHHYGKYSVTEVAKRKEDLYLRLGLQKCKERPDNAHAWYELGVQYWGMNREKDAYNAFIKSEQLNPHYVRPLIALAGISTIQKVYPKALRYYSRVMDIEPENIIPYLYLPTILIEMGNVSLAQDILRYGQRYAFGHPPYHINRGIVYQHLGNHRLAIECFDEALKINAREALAIYNKGVSCMALEELDLAEGYFRQIMDTSKVGYLATRKLIELYYKKEEPEKAMDVLNSIEKGEGLDDGLLFQKGVILLKKGLMVEARKVLDSIKKYDSFDQTGLSNLKKCFVMVGDEARATALDQHLLECNSNKDIYPQSATQSHCGGADETA
ncbi:MAG: glycosyltransferase fused to TPR-repeat protein [uncultured bacterium]|nr:MAG: glycosyltransferase fused to TPR-repeat protein [uncultured bacterium]